MQPTVTTSSSGGAAFDKLKASLAAIAKKQVYVGVPEDRTGRKKTTAVTNAGLIYIHTHGSPLQGIPPRPIIEPALEADDNKAVIVKKLGEAARAAFDGRPAKQLLNEAGIEGRNAAIRWFTDPDFAQSFTIQRSTGAFVLGGWQSATTSLTAVGIVTVAKERELRQVPEGDRVTGAMLFFSPTILYLSHGGGKAAVSDQLVWRGDTYRIAKVWPYVDFGFWKAFAVRMSGN
jgi:hypothetical protein